MARLFWLLFAAAVWIQAAPDPTPHSGVFLNADVVSYSPGRAFTAAIRIALDPGWHTYWKNPGDSGSPPSIRWDLPKGFKAKELAWPIPKIIPVASLVNYGYEKEHIILTQITPPDPAPAQATVRATVDYLVCKIECLPAKAQVSITLKRAPNPEKDPQGVRLAAPDPSSMPAGFHPWKFIARWGSRPTIDIIAPPQASLPPGAIRFIPRDELVIDNAAAQNLNRSRSRLALVPASNPAPKRLRGLMVAQSPWPGAGGAHAIEIDVPIRRFQSLFGSIALALLGGMLLNVMPCVFPVLSIKALGIAQLSGAARKKRRIHAAAYCAGILVSFWILTAALIAARALGAQVGWGFQLQSPVFVAFLALAMAALGLNLLGLFEIGTRFTRLGGLFRGEDGPGAFGTGILAVIVATPCTAPLMGPAVGYALTQPAGVTFAVFTALAAGMAAPLALIVLYPGSAKLLPKPGGWMAAFKRWLALPMFGAALWLGWVFYLQTARPSPPSGRWESYSATRLAALQKAKRPVFVDFTAAWCVTCQVNKRTTLSAVEVINAFEKRNVALLRADWTNRDSEIAAALAEHGRQGVPLYVLYGRTGSAQLLPELLTPGLILDALKKLDNTSTGDPL